MHIRKKNRVQFYSSSHKSSGLLELIHFDVFGPIKVALISKALYYISFIDYYSRRHIFSEVNMKSVVGLRILRVSKKIRLVGRLRC